MEVKREFYFVVLLLIRPPENALHLKLGESEELQGPGGVPPAQYCCGMK